MEVKIAEVYTPSDAQLKSNIHGSVNLEILGDDGTPYARLSGLTIRKSKEGAFFLAPPSYKVEKAGQDVKYYNHFALFPVKTGDEFKAFNEKQKDRMKALTDDVMRLIAKGGTKRNTQTPAPSIPPRAQSKAEPWG